MRQYAVLVIAVIVLIGGLVARRYLAPGENASTAVPAQVEAGTRALNAADALVSALVAGQRSAAELDPKVNAVRESCEALEQWGPPPACGTLRETGYALQRAARNLTIAETVPQEFQATVRALRAELGR